MKSAEGGVRTLQIHLRIDRSIHSAFNSVLNEHDRFQFKIELRGEFTSAIFTKLNFYPKK